MMPAIGVNCRPWLRSSTSARTLPALRSNSASSRHVPRIWAAYAMAVPTAPAPTTATLDMVDSLPRQRQTGATSRR